MEGELLFCCCCYQYFPLLLLRASTAIGAAGGAALDEGCRDGIAEGNRRGLCQGCPLLPADAANEHTMSFILASRQGNSGHDEGRLAAGAVEGGRLAADDEHHAAARAWFV
jgi:hypothetical protein